jgi:hypothetical protein
MKTLYVNGDSHTSGTYLDMWDNYNDCFAGLLSKRLGLKYINHALAGGSNARIIRTSKEYLEKQGNKDTIVLIGWSHPIRTEWYINNKWLQIAPGELYEVKQNPYLHKMWKAYINTLWDDKFNAIHLNRTVEQKYMIAEFSKWLYDKGMKHLFFHAKHSFFYKKNIFEMEWTSNPWLHKQPYNPTIAFCDFCQSKGHVADEHSHYSMEAHKDYADFVEADLKALIT